jgi:cell division protease FtsH
MPEGNQNQPPGDPGNRPGPPPPKVSRTLVSWLALLALVMLLLAVLNKNMTHAEPLSIDQFEYFVDKGYITEMVIGENGVLRGKLAPPAVAELKRTNNNANFEVHYPKQTFMGHEFLAKLREQLPNAKITFEQRSPFISVLILALPWLLIILFFWFVLARQIRNAGGGAGMLGNFGRSKHRVTAKEHTNVTFADVAGIEEAKDEVQEIIEFLRSPKKFARLGGRIPRGVLLVGEPGCGKTLLARAIAGEADVPFFSISGSDFVEMFVGVGASRVRDLFRQAKENAPCIIFLDEIDAVGRRRGATFSGGGHDEREQTLNAILVEMDGFDTSNQVIVIAATNRVDVLDPALTRPGRFDRQVFVSLPDLQGRYEIIKVHAKKIKLGPSVDIQRVARGTPMFSGAELAALVNEAALIATMNNKEFVEQDDLEEARDKVRWGRAKRSRVVDEQDRKLTAYHEAGHAVIQALEPAADPLHKVSIIPRGPAGGATFSLPERDRMVYARDYLLATLRILFGGRIAEEEFFGEVSSGAAQDIKQATEIVRHMVREWGMGESTGFMYYGDESGRPGGIDWPSREYSDNTAEALDREMRRLLDEAQGTAKAMVLEHRDGVETVAKALLQYETITGDEVNALLRGESIERASVTDLLDRAGTADGNVGMARHVSADPQTGEDLGQGPVPQPS